MADCVSITSVNLNNDVQRPMEPQAQTSDTVEAIHDVFLVQDKYGIIIIKIIIIIMIIIIIIIVLILIIIILIN